MTNSTETNTTPNYEAFPLNKFFGSQGRWAKSFRIVSISEDGYFNVRAALPTGPAFVALYEGEAFQVSSASGDGDGLASLTVVHAGLHGLYGTVEADGVTVAAVPPTNLIYRDNPDEHGHPNTAGGHRTFGTYTVCDPTAEYWITPPDMSNYV